jgi:hypothetical protein
VPPKKLPCLLTSSPSRLSQLLLGTTKGEKDLSQVAHIIHKRQGTHLGSGSGHGCQWFCSRFLCACNTKGGM